MIIPVISKIDSPLARIDDVKEEMSKLLGVAPDEIYGCSGRTGEGVEDVLRAVVEKVPPPEAPASSAPIAGTRALIFDFQYSDHQGVIVFVRLMNGAIGKGDKLEFAASGRSFAALEVGVFAPQPQAVERLEEGMIGYVVTGIKESGFARVGDTVRTALSRTPALEGYAEPKPVVWASIYPESQDDFPKLRSALGRLRLSDASFSFEEESSGTLGRGFRCGFLGMLHLEIIVERLRREHGLALVVTTPTITYEVETRDGERHTVYSPSQFPDFGHIQTIWEPYVEARVVVPTDYVSQVMQLLFDHEGVAEATENFSEGRVIIRVIMPLRELMRNFFDKIKTVSSGYASVSYEMRDMRQADVARLDIAVAEEVQPAFSRIVAKGRAYEEAVAAVEKLYKILPRQMFATKIHGIALGRILSSRTLPALSKDVTGYLYGGDRTRKMKLWAKQKRGKKRMQATGKVEIPEEVFMKMVKSE